MTVLLFCLINFSLSSLFLLPFHLPFLFVALFYSPSLLVLVLLTLPLCSQGETVHRDGEWDRQRGEVSRRSQPKVSGQLPRLPPILQQPHPQSQQLPALPHRCIQLLSGHSHLDIRTGLKSTLSTSTALFISSSDNITFLQPHFQRFDISLTLGSH